MRGILEREGGTRRVPRAAVSKRKTARRFFPTRFNTVPPFVPAKARTLKRRRHEAKVIAKRTRHSLRRDTRRYSLELSRSRAKG